MTNEDEAVGRTGTTYWHHRAVIAENVTGQLMGLISSAFPTISHQLSAIHKGWIDAIKHLETHNYPPDDDTFCKEHDFAKPCPKCHGVQKH